MVRIMLLLTWTSIVCEYGWYYPKNIIQFRPRVGNNFSKKLILISNGYNSLTLIHLYWSECSMKLHPSLKHRRILPICKRIQDIIFNCCVILLAVCENRDHDQIGPTGSMLDVFYSSVLHVRGGWRDP